MVLVLMVRCAPAIRGCLDSAREHDRTQSDNWRFETADSLLHAAARGARTHSAILFFEFTAIGPTLRQELIAFTNSCPAVPVCAALQGRRFDADELIALQRWGVRGFADEKVLGDPARLYHILVGATTTLACGKLLAMLKSQVDAAALRSVAASLANLQVAEDPNTSQRARSAPRTARNTIPPRDQRAGSEKFSVALRLLLLLFLCEERQQPVSKVCAIAGFPSADDARKLLARYAGIHAREVNNPQAVVSARVLLLQIILEGAGVPGTPGTRGRGDAGTRGRGDAGTRGRGDAGTRGRG